MIGLKEMNRKKEGHGNIVVETETFSKKKGVVVSRKWIALDSMGQGTILDLHKHDIMKRVQINARDLRLIDPLLSYPSAILGRGKTIVLNLEHIKAIITADKVLLRDPLNDDVVPIVEELQRRLPLAIGRGEVEEEELPGSEAGTNQQTEFPFEFRALEVALEGVCSFLDAQTRQLEVDAYPALDELTAKTSSRNLDRVRKMKSAMTRLISRVQKVRDELEQLLEDDDDMVDRYLSRKSAMSASISSSHARDMWQLAADESPAMSSNMSRSSSGRTSAATSRQEGNNVEELEMLLEAYFMQIESTMNKLNTLREYIDDTEDYINIQVVLLTALVCGSIFVWIISHARHKGLLA